MVIMPRVAMNGGIRNIAIRLPLTAPRGDADREAGQEGDHEPGC